MATINEVLFHCSLYPITDGFLAEVAVRRGINLEEEATASGINSPSFQLAKADIYNYLAAAPNISQGGQNYSFTDEQRKEFKRKAINLYRKYSPSDEVLKDIPTYGYKGDRL